MPTRKTVQKKKNGNNNQTPLEAAVRDMIQSTATLVQNQALFNQQIAQYNAELREIERANSAELRASRAELREIERANAERFARIEQLLLRHELMLQELPEAIRQKIGFQQK